VPYLLLERGGVALQRHVAGRRNEPSLAAAATLRRKGREEQRSEMELGFFGVAACCLFI
jgi:hypothetical protein